MMPWWSWLIIWTVLVAGLLGMLVYFAISLFRRFLGIYEEFSVLMEHAEELSATGDALRAPPPRPPAIFGDRAELELEVERLRHERLIRKQLRRDARIRRAKMISTASPN